MLENYLPILVFIGIGIVIGAIAIAVESFLHLIPLEIAQHERVWLIRRVLEQLNKLIWTQVAAVLFGQLLQ